MNPEKEKQLLIRGYQDAGNIFLAYRLKKIFTPILNDEDRALHNQMLDEIYKMIDTQDKKATFFEEVANVLTLGKLKKKKAKRSFLEFIKAVANKVIMVANKGKG